MNQCRCRLYPCCSVVISRQNYSRREIDGLRNELNNLQLLQLDNRQLISATDALANLALVPAQSGWFHPVPNSNLD